MADSLDKKFYKIREVSELLDIPVPTLRFWESRFGELRPRRNSGGTRFYTPGDIETIRLIRFLVHERGLKIDAARELLHRNRRGVEKRHEVVRRLQKVRCRLTDLLRALDSRKI